MSWLAGEAWQRPIVVVEDHLYHIGELLELLERKVPEALGLLSVLCLERSGPDTERAVSGWRERYPAVRIAAAVDPATQGVRALEAEVFEQHGRFVRMVAELLRPGGLLLQDVQLETLTFVPRDRWWESILLASTVRGMFGERPPVCRFLSNKKGYEVTFPRDLAEAGFDPLDVLDKNELEKMVVPTVRSFLARSMPLRLRVIERGEMTLETVAQDGAAERAEIEAVLDLVLWELGGGVELGGGALAPGFKKPLVFKPGQPAGETWRALVADLFEGGAGVPVVEVGERVAPELALRPEVINCAARHVHQLRSRLSDRGLIVNVEGAYRLSDRLKVGRVTEGE